MKMRLNPIVKKDLQVTARSMRLSWGLFAYEAVLVMAFLLALSIIQASGGNIYSSGNIYGSLIYLFPVLAVSQVCIVALIVPVLTASSISGEKERQTFDLMLTTCMSPFSIVLGKVLSAVMHILFYVIGSLPIMALSFVVGGMKWIHLFYFLLAIIMLSVFSGSIGIFCSSLSRKSIASVILSFVFYFLVYFMTFVPLFIRLIINSDKIGESLLWLLFNPIVFFEEFFTQLMTDESLLTEASFTVKQTGYITYFLSNSKAWIFASAICILGLSLLFMLAAAWRVNPLHSSAGKKPKKGK